MISSNLIWPIDGILTGTLTQGSNRPGSIANEWVLHTPQISRIEASPSDAVSCHTQDTILLLVYFIIFFSFLSSFLLFCYFCSFLHFYFVIVFSFLIFYPFLLIIFFFHFCFHFPPFLFFFVLCYFSPFLKILFCSFLNIKWFTQPYGILY